MKTMRMVGTISFVGSQRLFQMEWQILLVMEPLSEILTRYFLNLSSLPLIIIFRNVERIDVIHHGVRSCLTLGTYSIISLDSVLEINGCSTGLDYYNFVCN